MACDRSGVRVQNSGFRVQGSGFRVQGSGSRVQGPGYRLSGDVNDDVEGQPGLDQPVHRFEPATPECWRGLIHSNAPLNAISTFENHFLEGKLTFGDPLLDSGVVVVGMEAVGVRVQGFGFSRSFLL